MIQSLLCLLFMTTIFALKSLRTNLLRGYPGSVNLIRMMATVPPNPYGLTLQQTMLRIKDPKKSVPFYEDNFGFKLLHRYDFEQWKFSLYFMGILRDGVEWPSEVPSKASEKALWSMEYASTLELTHNWGSEDDPSWKANNGNVEPNRGFGHIAVAHVDVYQACEQLESNGVAFQKKPNEGRMKGLAFVKDPDGYWIEVVKKGDNSEAKTEYHLTQTMLRIKDPKKSIPFYTDVLGMTLCKEIHFGPDQGDFSLYFLASLPPGTVVPDAIDLVRATEFIDNMYPQVIELTHNHGTENDPDFQYHDGNTEDIDNGIFRGFGHTGFLVDDLAATAKYFDSKGVSWKKRPEEGNMKNHAFIYDPDGYAIEIVGKGMEI